MSERRGQRRVARRPRARPEPPAPDGGEAYRQWVCATLVPAFVGGRRVRPCRAVCQRVEQRCPFFLPGDRAPNLPTQYAGEPTFLCLDTNIPETGEQRERSLFADEPAGECCFRPCEGGGGGGGGVCLSAGCEGGSPRPAPAAHLATSADTVFNPPFCS
ncbi:NALCN channel auxiliary factor 1 [Schistocerca gregaria]|uniref:NALCN channel auxiliary factor 1 n=1 Tax=Schistocerca gregaria TaxID=7010 RepID=UPI00211DB119|nr:NALCN channel auxiliary factor 1 [Schistocerca gregaria]